MKYNLLLLLCSTFLFSCKKKTTEQCFKVKWLDGICAINIYQIQDSAYMYLGEDNYILSKDGKVYDNIFVQSNYCDNIILKQKFYFSDIYFWYSKRQLDSNHINQIKIILENNIINTRDKILLKNLIKV
mgnify:CR=1 FL=1